MSLVWDSDPPFLARERMAHRRRVQERAPQVLAYTTEHTCDHIERYLGIRGAPTNAVPPAPAPVHDPAPPQGRAAGRLTVALFLAALAASSILSLAGGVWGVLALARHIGGN